MNNTEPSNIEYAPKLTVSLDDVLTSITESKLLSSSSHDVHQPDWFIDNQQSKAELAYLNDPELVSLFVANKIEGLHGTRSGSLLSILKHGLVTPLNQSAIETPSLSGEHYSQATPREGVHFVHWLNEAGTVQFADEATSRKNDALTLHNYREALDISDEFIQQIHPTLALRTHLENRKKKAKVFDAWLNSDAATPEELEMHERDFPVVIGATLDAVPADDISPVQSAVSGDYFVKNDIPEENIKIVFVPEEQIDYTRTALSDKDVRIVALERLRSLN